MVQSISVIIPTYNAADVLTKCLYSIGNQNYPKDRIEIIIVDAGSTDKTLEIAKKYTNKIYPNLLKTAEAGKAVGIKYAQNEIIAFIDSDNILPEKNWLKKMVEPFSDSEIIGTEPIKYTYRKKDGYITRYCALIGMNDPICFFLENYDRYSYLSEKWTGLNIKIEERENYLKLFLDKNNLPTIGANGTMIRKKLVEKYKKQEYLFDIDIIYDLVLQGKNKFAKVKISIIHLFSGTIFTFYRKQKRRIKDYLFYSKKNLRKYNWGEQKRFGLFKFILYCVLIFPLFIQILIGYCHKPDKAWLFHPLACWITLLVYGKEKIFAFFRIEPMNREGWRQCR